MDNEKLGSLVDRHDASGVCVEDAGNGSIGMYWLDWDDVDNESIDVRNVTMRALDAQERESVTTEWQSVIDDNRAEPMAISDWIWIESDDRTGQSNPYRVRFIF